MVRELQCKTKEERIKLILCFDWFCINKLKLKSGCSYWVLNRLHIQITQAWIQITSVCVNTKICRASFLILKSNIFLSYIRSKTAHLNAGFCIAILNARILPLSGKYQLRFISQLCTQASINIHQLHLESHNKKVKVLAHRIKSMHLAALSLLRISFLPYNETIFLKGTTT